MNKRGVLAFLLLGILLLNGAVLAYSDECVTSGKINSELIRSICKSECSSKQTQTDINSCVSSYELLYQEAFNAKGLFQLKSAGPQGACIDLSKFIISQESKS